MRRFVTLLDKEWRDVMFRVEGSLARHLQSAFADVWEGAPGEILIGEHELQARIRELGEEISADYQGRDLLLVGVLKGAVFFLADLMRHLTVPCEIDFMAISSYGDSTDSSGVVRILKDLDINIEGRHVLVVEDIIDSGLQDRRGAVQDDAGSGCRGGTSWS